LHRRIFTNACLALNKKKLKNIEKNDWYAKKLLMISVFGEAFLSLKGQQQLNY